MGSTDDTRDLRQSEAQRTRAEILAGTDHGHAGPTGYLTDFTAPAVGGLHGLRAMIEHADPAALDAVADHWTAVSGALLAARTDVHAHTAAALEHWSGPAADGFAARARQLQDSLSNGAAYAGNANTAITSASSALRTAQRAMPQAPSEWQKISRRLTTESGDQQFTTDLHNGLNRESALTLDATQLSATEQRHQQAILVMQTLEQSYTKATTTLGTAPAGSIEAERVWPPPPAAVPQGQVTGSDGDALSGPGMARPLRMTLSRATGTREPADSFFPVQGSSEPMSRTEDDGIIGGAGPHSTPRPDMTIDGVLGGLGAGGAGGADAADSASPSAADLDDGGRFTPVTHYALVGAPISFDSLPFELGPGAGTGGDLGAGEHVSRPFGAVGEFAVSAVHSGSGRVIGDASAVAPDIEATGKGASGGLGMGGFPGARDSRGEQRRRRSRPDYLVEDPESWVSGVAGNPPVIM